jgi:hypothetical protein
MCAGNEPGGTVATSCRLAYRLRTHRSKAVVKSYSYLKCRLSANKIASDKSAVSEKSIVSIKLKFNRKPPKVCNLCVRRLIVQLACATTHRLPAIESALLVHLAVAARFSRINLAESSISSNNNHGIEE